MGRGIVEGVGEGKGRRGGDRIRRVKGGWENLIL